MLRVLGRSLDSRLLDDLEGRRRRAATSGSPASAATGAPGAPRRDRRAFGDDDRLPARKADTRVALAARSAGHSRRSTASQALVDVRSDPLLIWLTEVESAPLDAVEKWLAFAPAAAAP